MLTAHEILGFMSPSLALEMLEQIHQSEKAVYRAIVNSVAEVKKVRPVFLEHKPRAERNQELLATLVKPRLEPMAVTLLQTWLLKNQTAMLVQFLDELGIKNQNGAVDDLPETVDDAKLKAAVDNLLAKFPREHVAVYLRAFNDLNDTQWPTLAEMLDKDARLQLGA
jgi:hypothetical protein